MINYNKIFLVVCLLLLSTYGFGEDTVLSLGKRRKIPSIGMSIRTFSGLQSNPIQFPHSYSLKNGKGKVYQTSELWRYKQYLGSWKNDLAQVIISEMSISVPKNKSLYTSGKNKYLTPNARSVSWSKNEVGEWLNYYMGSVLSSGKLLFSTSYGLKVTEYKYSGSDEENRTFLYSIEAKRGVKKIIFIQFKVKSSIKIKKIKSLIYKSLKSIRFYRMGKESKTYNEGRNSKYKNSSSEYKDARDRVLQNIKNLKNWWYLDSGNFILVTNVPSKSKKDIYKIRKQLDQLSKLYSLFYKRKSNAKVVNVVRIFNERSDYIRYVGEDKKWTGGLWMPGKKELVISPVINSNNNEQLKNRITVLNHEAFHQYIHFAADEVQPGPWFNEGNAAFFEEIEFKRGKADILPAKYQANLINIIKGGKTPDIKGLLNMNYEEFYSGSSTQDNYTLAWGVVYFLNKGLPYIKSRYASSYSKILPIYYKELIRTQDNNKATAKAWKNINMKQFTEDFVKFYNSSSMLRKAENYNIVNNRIKGRR
ncbi:MAG TPA: hypothetical protein QF753_01510 [Victivallales bacterium]|nr:hypothetical protein [Victivallales bacterium]